jgi:hypothetical protein
MTEALFFMLPVKFYPSRVTVFIIVFFNSANFTKWQTNLFSSFSMLFWPKRFC